MLFRSRVWKTLFTNFYVIDHKKRTYYKSDFTTMEKETFKLAVNMKTEDENYNQLVARYDLERDVDEFERARSEERRVGKEWRAGWPGGG